MTFVKALGGRLLVADGSESPGMHAGHECRCTLGAAIAIAPKCSRATDLLKLCAFKVSYDVSYNDVFTGGREGCV